MPTVQFLTNEKIDQEGLKELIYLLNNQERKLFKWADGHYTTAYFEISITDDGNEILVEGVVNE